MHPLIIVACIACTGVVLALALLFRKLNSSGGSLPVTAEWIEELSIEHYRPMIRLLDSEDIEFLRSQPGFTPAMATKLRVQRCQIFRDYLRCLTMDFSRVSTALKIVMFQSGLDRPDLASILVHHQMMFTCSLVLVHIRLFLYRWGVCDVDVTSLVKIFDVVRLELQSMVPMAEAVCA